jgi:hypothetical protein
MGRFAWPQVRFRLARAPAALLRGLPTAHLLAEE